MNDKTKGAAAAKSAATEAPANDTEVIVKVLVNGALINGCHHAVGKTMPLPKSKADVLVGMNPPQVEIIGV